MTTHAKSIEKLSEEPCKTGSKHIKQQVEENADKQCREVGHDLIAGNTARPQSNAYISCRHKGQSQVATNNRSHIQVPDTPDGNHIGKGKNQCNQYQQQG